MMKLFFGTFLLLASARVMAAAQQTHFACQTLPNSVITVQEDAGGNISLIRTDSEQVADLGMTSMNQKQILTVNQRDREITNNPNDDKTITLKFHGTTGDSQIQLLIQKAYFGSVERMTISGSGPALDRVNKLISAAELGINFHGCRIEIKQ